MVPSLSTGRSATDSDLEPLDEKLQPIEAVAQCVQRTSNRREKLRRVGVCERVLLSIGGLHRALACQQPLPADRERCAERHDKVHTRGLPLEIPPNCFGVCARHLADSAIRAITHSGEETFMQW